MGTKFLAKNPKTAVVIHENKSQGVLYEFMLGARKWRERQKRSLCVGGPLHGEMHTRYEMEIGKYPTFYLPYKASGPDYVYPMIFAFVGTE